MEQILQQILARFDSLETRFDSLESGQKEIYQISRAIRDRQDETDARLESLSMTVYRIEGELTATKDILHIFRSETDVNFKKIDRRIKLIESDLDETMVKVAEITIPRN